MTPQEILTWTFGQQRPTVVTTSFGHQAAVLLHMSSQINPNVPILWLDTGFNTTETLAFKDYICNRLDLNVVRYAGVPWTDEVPESGTNNYERFVEQVKIEPFQRAFRELAPSYWITGIRREQTAVRKQSSHFVPNGNLMKVAPLLDWTDIEMDKYLQEHNLPNEPTYYDPTKPDRHLECGIHTTAL